MIKTIQINLTGIVQGVGFRPFTANLARNLGINGTVKNTGSGVEITATAEEAILKKFMEELCLKAPAGSHIAEMAIKDIPLIIEEGFAITESEDRAGSVFVPMDRAICPECVFELEDPCNPRYRYPFINCTHCGPRYTIIEDLPYDRPNTTMKDFDLCPECRKEYTSPENRRYHAQPNACPVCGPQVRMGNLAGEEAVRQAARLVDEGEIVALKGIGGYHLICDATNGEAVQKLRTLKRRPTKPLAVMFRSEEDLGGIDEKVKKAVFSPEAPIVIFKWVEHPLAREINPLGDEIGIMQPYSPLHKVLLSCCKTPFIIATSGNRQDEPIVSDEKEAEETLGIFTENFLHHNRPIKTRIDDSVATWMAGELRLLRRGRGYAPFPVKFPAHKATCRRIFAAGAHLKSTLAMTKGRYGFVSQYLGDLDNAGTVAFYKETFEQMVKLLKCQPEIAVCDLHDGYFSSNFAERLGIPLIRLQHHQAHLYACMAEHGLTDNVIGVIFDGTGYGTDGNLWGGEFFVLSDGELVRKVHLQYVPQPAGDASVKYPARMAQSWLMQAGIWEEEFWASRMGMDMETVRLNESLIKNQINTFPTSSMGRLFEAAGAMVLGINKNEYEAHAAIALESVARDSSGTYPFQLEEGILFMEEAFREMAREIRKGADIGAVSGKFHNTLAVALRDICLKIALKTKIYDVVLAGGVFQNKRLTESAEKLLQEAGFRCLIPVKVPVNDGGISLGQAYYAYLHHP